MLNRILIAIAVFTAIAAYQFGYYQGRLSVSGNEQSRIGKNKLIYTGIAQIAQPLPPITTPRKQKADSFPTGPVIPVRQEGSMAGE